TSQLMLISRPLTSLRCQFFACPLLVNEDLLKSSGHLLYIFQFLAIVMYYHLSMLEFEIYHLIQSFLPVTMFESLLLPLSHPSSRGSNFQALESGRNIPVQRLTSPMPLPSPSRH